VIGRRTNEKVAIEYIDDALKKLGTKYDFLKYITMKKAVYSGEMEAVGIDPKIDNIEKSNLGKALSDLIDVIIKLVSKDKEYDFENAEYYFLKEVQDEIGDEYDITLKEFGVDLDLKQSEFVLDMKEEAKARIRKINISRVLENIIKVLISLLSKSLSEEETIKNVIDSIKKLENKYDFLKYVEISDKPDSKGYYNIAVKDDINGIWSAKIGEAVEKLIVEIGRLTDSKVRQSFLNEFKSTLGNADISKIKDMGVDLDHVNKMLQRPEHEILFKGTLEALIAVMSEKTSTSFAVASIDTLIEKLRDKYAVFRYVQIDKFRYNDGISAFNIMPEIESADPYQLAKSIQELIKNIQSNFEDKSSLFIQDFKKKLGDDRLSEIKKIGVNLHILELRRLM